MQDFEFDNNDPLEGKIIARMPDLGQGQTSIPANRIKSPTFTERISSVMVLFSPSEPRKKDSSSSFFGLRHYFSLNSVSVLTIIVLVGGGIAYHKVANHHKKTEAARAAVQKIKSVPNNTDNTATAKVEIAAAVPGAKPAAASAAKPTAAPNAKPPVAVAEVPKPKTPPEAPKNIVVAQPVNPFEAENVAKVAANTTVISPWERKESDAYSPWTRKVNEIPEAVQPPNEALLQNQAAQNPPLMESPYPPNVPVQPMVAMAPMAPIQTPSVPVNPAAVNPANYPPNYPVNYPAAQYPPAPVQPPIPQNNYYQTYQNYPNQPVQAQVQPNVQYPYPPQTGYPIPIQPQPQQPMPVNNNGYQPQPQPPFPPSYYQEGSVPSPYRRVY